jgi:hypothetical protein
MRWFGEAWQEGTDAERSRVREDYRLHLASLAPNLPASFLLLVEGGGSISLHDGQLLMVFQEEEDDSLVLDIYVGEDHPPAGSLVSVLHVRVVYRGAQLMTPQLRELQRLIHTQMIQVLYPELDRADDGRLEHRLSIWKGRDRKTFEIAIQFEHADVVPVRFQGVNATVIMEREQPLFG